MMGAKWKTPVCRRGWFRSTLRIHVCLLLFVMALLSIFCKSKFDIDDKHDNVVSRYPSAQSKCDGVEKRYYFSLCAVFKEQAINMHEWISHYLLEGADHIFLVDNGSQDNFMPVVQPFVDKGLVTVMINARQHVQQQILEHYVLPILNVTEWMLNVDLDEILYAKEGSIAEVLRAAPCNIAAFAVPWKMFGSSGHKEHPKGSLVKNFQWRSSAQTNPNFKTVFRSSMTNSFSIHTAEVTGETLSMEIGENCGGNDGCGKAMQAGFITTPNALQLNHYAIQSLQWFVKTKMSRGDVMAAQADSLRSFDYFEAYDKRSNGTQDTELYEKHKELYDSL